MSIRSVMKKQRRRNLREMRYGGMNKRKRRCLVDYSVQNMRLYQESLERKRKKPIIVVIYER